MVKKTRFPVVSPEVTASSVCALNKAIERRQIISFKVPLRIVALHDTVKKKEPYELPKPLCCHNTLPAAVPFSHLIPLFFPFKQPSLLIFLPYSYVALITTL